MASGFVIYYSIWALFATHLQKDLSLSPGMIATPIAIANLVAFLASGFWGVVADILGRRWSMIIPAFIGIFVAPMYLLTTDPGWIIGGFILQGCFAGAIYGQNPSYLTERFPTEVRSTAAGFCYHQGAIWGGFVAPILTYFAINYNLGFGIPMMIGTCAGSILFIIALLLGPETKGMVMVGDLDALIHEPGGD
jgi:SHS family lactate transporter-like MFS transporter